MSKSIRRQDLEITASCYYKEGCYMAFCPCCVETSLGPDGSGHMEVDMKKGVWHCHRCKAGGVLTGTAMKEWTGSSVITQMKPPEPKHIGKYTRLTEDSQAWLYLRSRGFSDEHIKKLDPHMGESPYYVYFPMREGEKTIFWNARLLNSAAFKKAKKWLIYPAEGHDRIERNTFLYQYPYNTPQRQRWVLVEGIFDAVWNLNRMAMLGSFLTRYQKNMLINLNPTRITFALDKDAESKTLAMIAQMAQEYSSYYYMVDWPDDRDPCDWGEEGDEVIKNYSVRIA